MQKRSRFRCCSAASCCRELVPSQGAARRSSSRSGERDVAQNSTLRAKQPGHGALCAAMRSLRKSFKASQWTSLWSLLWFCCRDCANFQERNISSSTTWLKVMRFRKVWDFIIIIGLRMMIVIMRGMKATTRCPWCWKTAAHCIEEMVPSNHWFYNHIWSLCDIFRSHVSLPLSQRRFVIL